MELWWEARGRKFIFVVFHLWLDGRVVVVVDKCE